MQLDDLNPRQRDAVNHGEGPAVVIAGAGSGKTRVLTYRIAKLIQDGVPAAKILACTFTRKAAGEMQERLAGLVGAAVEELTVGTIHSLCFRILREEWHNQGLRYETLEENQQKRYIREIMAPRTASNPWGLNLDLDAGMVLSTISRLKNDLITPDELARRLDVEDYPWWMRDMLAVYRQYERRKDQERKLDFDDMLLWCYQLLSENRAVLRKWQRRFEHVLVDEFQDTNMAQWEILRMLAAPENNLFVVGDDAQSVYGFRGAHPELIVRFRDYYPEAIFYVLDINYRSVEPVVSLGNRIIAANTSQYPKELKSNRGPGHEPYLLQALDEDHEADIIVREILALVGERRINGQDQYPTGKTLDNVLQEGPFDCGDSQAVRLFSHDSQSALERVPNSCEIEGSSARPRQHTVARRSIPHEEWLHRSTLPGTSGSEQTRLCVRAPIGHGERVGAAAETERASAPYQRHQDRQQTGESAGIHEPCRSHETPRWSPLEDRSYTFGDIAILMRTNAQTRAFEDAFVANNIPYCIVGSVGFYRRKEVKDLVAYLRVVADPGDEEAVKRVINVPSRYLGQAFVRDVEAYAKRAGCTFYRALTRTPGLKPYQLRGAQQFVEIIGTVQAEEYRPAAAIRMIRDMTDYDKYVRQDAEEADDDRIANLDALEQAAAKFPDIPSFLRYVAMMEGRDTEATGDRVQLLSIHRAKGLEWPVVFVAGVSDGLLPHARAENVEEERRLCYVAVTRAKDRLFLSVLNSYRGRPVEPSPFLAEAGILVPV